jgi:hypothetical protein
LATGLITRTEQATLNCGGTLFDEKKQFCQRTFTTRNSTGNQPNDSGFFVSYNKASGVLSAANYPVGNYDAITNAESAYNLAGNQPNVTSRVLPLCGTDPTLGNSSTNSIALKHAGGANTATPAVGATVYNALQHCGRNLIFKIGDVTGGNSSDLWNGKTIEGGQLDKDGANPFSKAWSVQNNGACYIGLAETNPYPPGIGFQYGINGFTFTGTNRPASASAVCSFIGAVPSTTVPPYSTCPPETPLVGLDDVGCIAKESCLFYSTIDNTCLVGKETGSLFGKTTYDSAYVVIYDINGTGSGGDTVASFRNYSESVNDRGIYRTKLGSRYGRGAGTAATLDRNGNMWSRECKTLNASRFGFYAVNDPYLTNKKWKDNWATKPLITIASGGTPSNTNDQTGGANSVPPPICGGLSLKGDTTLAPIPFDDAFACIKGQLSVYYPATAATNDGNNWDRPIYCVQQGKVGEGVFKEDEACYVSSVEVTSSNCLSTVLTNVTANGGVINVSTAAWSEAKNACLITAGTITDANCGNITKASVPRSTPLISVPNINTTDVANATHGGLAGSWTNTSFTDNSTNPATVYSGGCVLSATAAPIVQGGSNVDPFSATNCKSISNIKQTGANEIKAKGFYSGSSCVVVAQSGGSLEAFCNSVDLVRSSDLSTNVDVDATGSWE